MDTLPEISIRPVSAAPAGVKEKFKPTFQNKFVSGAHQLSWLFS